MTATPQSELDSRLNTLDKHEANGDVSTTDADALRSFVAAYNRENTMTPTPRDDKALAPGGCATYLNRLTEAARHLSLTDADADDVNSFLDAAKDGENNSTASSHASAFRKFYGYHDTGPDPDEITTIATSNTGRTFDPDDVLTKAEIHELLNAAGNPRDKAIVALLIYTGMRNNALRSLRVGDVDPQAGPTGRWTVPDEADGLKNLGKYGHARPLLGAKGAIQEWLSYHPASDDDDAFLITGRPKYGKCNPHQKVAGSTIRRALDGVVENTGNPTLMNDPEDGGKPTHPHMMRHTFVTVCKREYDMDDDTIRHLVGHASGSKVMETTYAHLDDDHFNTDAEDSFGYDTPDIEDAGSLTPPACEICGNDLAPDAKSCERCGAVYAPDAHAVEAELDKEPCAAGDCHEYIPADADHCPYCGVNQQLPEGYADAAEKSEVDVPPEVAERVGEALASGDTDAIAQMLVETRGYIDTE